MPTACTLSGRACNEFTTDLRPVSSNRFNVCLNLKAEFLGAIVHLKVTLNDNVKCSRVEHLAFD